MLRYLDWLEQTAWAVSIRQSLWLYPALEIVHIVGIVLLVGAALLFDLRLLGQAPHLSVGGLARYLLPWSRRGLVLVVPSGLLLFITNARTLGTDPTFGLKLLLLALAALNVWVFHTFVSQSTPDEPPAWAKISAVVSILLWMGVIACGRLLAY